MKSYVLSHVLVFESQVVWYKQMYIHTYVEQVRYAACIVAYENEE